MPASKVRAASLRIVHQVRSPNNDIHYKLQCYQATHGSEHGMG